MRTDVRENPLNTADMVQKIVESLSSVEIETPNVDEEYVAVVKDGEVHIFLSRAGVDCHCLRGSVISHDERGMRKIDWFEVFLAEKEPDIAQYVRERIWDYWEYEFKTSDRHRGIMYSSRKIVNL